MGSNRLPQKLLQIPSRTGIKQGREGIRISYLGQKCALITEYKRPHGMMMSLLEESELISSSYMLLFVRRTQSASPVAQK